MKKKLIAIAVAGAMAAPMAVMADVKISGQLQTQLVSYSGDVAPTKPKGVYMSDGGTVTGANGGSWGAISINASEDLGGGMKAMASYGFNVTTDTGINTRQAFVGLSGDFGTVLAGRMNHPYKTSTISWDPFVATFMQSRLNGGMGGTAAGALYGPETSNALAYANSFGGVRVVAAAVVDELRDDAASDKLGGNHGYAFSVNAPVGPVEVALAHAVLNMSGCRSTIRLDGNGVPVLNDNNTGLAVDTTCRKAEKATATKLGVMYRAGDLNIGGQVEMLGEGMGADKGNVYFVTAGYKMGANKIDLSLGQTSKKLNGGDNNVTHAALGLSHSFSSKTNVFAGVSQTRAEDYKFNAVGTGLRVRF